MKLLNLSAASQTFVSTNTFLPKDKETRLAIFSLIYIIQIGTKSLIENLRPISGVAILINHVHPIKPNSFARHNIRAIHQNSIR